MMYDQQPRHGKGQTLGVPLPRGQCADVCAELFSNASYVEDAGWCIFLKM